MWTFLAVFSFALFLGGAFASTRFAFDAQGHFQAKARPLLAVTLVALLVWLVALRLAPPPYPVEKTRFYVAPN